MDLLGSTAVDNALAQIIRDGLPPARRRAHVIIAGAGMAGLVAGYELLRAGHQVTLLEARNRVGGRIYTVRDCFADGLYAEMGAMRIPTAHGLTMAYIERFGLPTAPFRSNNDAAYTFIHGVQRRQHEPLGDAFDLAPHERGLELSTLLERTLAPLRARIATEGEAGWAAIHEEWEHVSLRDFLLRSGWSQGAIDLFGIMTRHESLMDTSFIEFFRGSNDVSSPMVRILGGMDRLPNAFLGTLEKHLRYGARVRAVEQGPDFVRVDYENAAGRRTLTGDYLIMTLPYSLLRHIEITPEFSTAKQRAIRQIHYDNASKIFFQFRRRFWEEEGIGWGSTVTDLPIRNVVYPEPEGATDRGLLIASYTWAQDAQRWAALADHERIAQALENLSRIHPRAPEYFEAGASHMWQTDPCAGGAYTVFQPGQQRRLHDAICMPEGRIHFAGEHTSLLHRWVEGAVESALRVALEVSLATQRRSALRTEHRAASHEPPANRRGEDAFRTARAAIQAGDAALLAAVVAARPEVVRQHHPTTEAPFDGALAWATLLHCAVAEKLDVDPLPLVRVLLDAGADVHALCGGGPASPRDDARATALTLAASRSTGTAAQACALIDLLVEHGADPDENAGRPIHRALCAASRHRHLAAVAPHLHRRGARLDLAFAAGLGELPLLERWLRPVVLPTDAYERFRPETDRLDASDRAALLAEALAFAAQAGRLEAATRLLNSGADPSALVPQNGIRRSALHAAAAADQLDMVALLLDRGADPHVADSEWSASPLSWAAVSGAYRAVELLRGRGLAQVNDLIYLGRFEEIAAALGGRHPDRAHTLGAPGVLLRNAAFAGREEICEGLLALGADPNLASPLGQTPADVAAQAGHTALAARLRRSKSDS